MIEDILPILGFILSCLILLFLSLRERIKIKRRTVNRGLVPEPKPSVMSQSLMDLIGTAGGIYLSLLALVSFLKVQLPEEIIIMGIGLEPLAFMAFIIAIVEPFIRSRLTYIE